MQPLPLPQPAAIKHLENNSYQVTLEPMYPGYGMTVGTALRRVLLSSMPGAAVTAVKIKFVDHEFSTIPNVKEDVIQVILNLKQLRLRSYSQEPVRLSLQVKGEGVVTAAQITKSDMVEVRNPELVICTLDSKQAELDMELIIEQGRGYSPVESREHQNLETGMLAIDAIFTPVRSVYFDVTNVRVGQITNFDKLTMNLETDGTITGGEAIDIAGHILVDHFTMLFNHEGEARIEEIGAGALTTAEANIDDADSDDESPVEAAETDLDDLQLSNRARNALLKAGLVTVAQVKALSDEDINNIPGLGEKTINETLQAIGRA